MMTGGSGSPMNEVRRDFSICMATYNGRDFIGDQLRSILADMRQGDELIIVDDRSSDGTPDAVTALLAEATGIHWRLVVLDENVGHKEAFRRAIVLASCPLAALSDQDDIWPAGRLDGLSEMIEGNSVALVFGSLCTFGMRGRHPMDNPTLTLRGARGLLLFLLLRLALRRRLYAFGSACAFRTSAIDANVPITTETHEQWLLSQGLARGGVHFSPRVVTLRRLHENNATRVRPLWRRAQAFILSCPRLWRTMRRLESRR